MAVAHAEAQPPGYVDFGKFAPSTSAEQFVEVNLKGNLLKLAAQFTRKDEPDVAALIASLDQVRVNVVGLGEDNRAEVGKRLGTIRAELVAKGWERIVNVQEKSQDVGIFLKAGQGDVVEGLVVTVVDGDKEAVLINIVGNVKLEQVGKLGERLNIEPLKKVGGAARPEAAPASGDKK